MTCQNFIIMKFISRNNFYLIAIVPQTMSKLALHNFCARLSYDMLPDIKSTLCLQTKEGHSSLGHLMMLEYLNLYFWVR